MTSVDVLDLAKRATSFTTSFALSQTDTGQGQVTAGDIKKLKLRVLAGSTLKKQLPTKGWRLYLNSLLNEPSSSYLARNVSYIQIFLIIGTIGVMILQSCKGFGDNDYDWFAIETFFSVAFTVELLCRCAVQYETVKEVFQDAYFYIDTLAVLPYYMEQLSGYTLPDLVQAIRVVRLFKLARQFQGTITLLTAIQDSSSALTVPTFFLVICCCTFGVVLYYVEQVGVNLEEEKVDPIFNSIPEAIWFIFVTMTTVGYGDMVPSSTLCKVINVAAMLFGILFVSMPIAIVGENFVNAWQDRDRVTLIARIRDGLLKKGSTKKDVRDAFAQIDLDKSGSLNFREFAVALQMMRIDMTLKKKQKLWKAIDTDNSGKIMVDEFAELVFPDVDLDPEDEMPEGGEGQDDSHRTPDAKEKEGKENEDASALPPLVTSSGMGLAKSLSTNNNAAVGHHATAESLALNAKMDALTEKMDHMQAQFAQQFADLNKQLSAITGVYVGGTGSVGGAMPPGQSASLLPVG